MKLPKALLGAILVGITVQASSCTKGELPEPTAEQIGKNSKDSKKAPLNCPACGMG